MKALFKAFYGFICLILILGCGSRQEHQMSGIVAEAKYETVACQPKSKLINIRNDDTTQPQRIQGIHFEPGTNDKNYFKLDKASYGDNEIKAQSSKIEEVIIPAGGVLSVQATYLPKEITTGNSHVSYLDFFMNGPKLGIMQVKLDGKAETALEGCGKASANQKTFKVDKATLQIIKSDANGGAPQEFDVTATSDMIIDIAEDGKVKMAKEGFPTLTMPLPAGLRAPTLTITMSDDAEGTFQDNDLEFASLNLLAIVIPIPSVKLTTKSVSATAPKGEVQKTGSKLANGKMKLVLAVPVPNDSNLEAFKDGVIAAELELSEK